MAKQKSYLEQRREMKLAGKKPPAEKRADASKKSKFFKDAIEKMPGKCMECGKALGGTIAINPTATVAHILPKRKNYGVTSMANDKRNMVYLCITCHTNMDNKGCRFIEKMRIFPLLKERVALMFKDIPAAERRFIPDCLNPA